MNRRHLLAGLSASLFAGSAGKAHAESKHPPIGKFIEVEGIRLHYVDEGSGPAIVLIHGASGNIRDWTFSMVGRLKDRFRVIAIDRPGLGYSGRIAGDGANPAEQARVFAAAVEALGEERVLIAGHSWGGALATAWALNRPDQVAGAAILAGATMPWGGDGGLLYRLGASEVSPILSSIARVYVGNGESEITRVFKPDTPPPGYIDYLGVELALRRSTFRWNAEDIDELNDNLVNISPRYPELAMPMEVLHGDADTIVGLDIHSRPLVKAAQNARLTVLKGTGHMPQHAREDEVIAAFDRLRVEVFG